MDKFKLESAWINAGESLERRSNYEQNMNNYIQDKLSYLAISCRKVTQSRVK
jgi:hypothetical protein